MTRSYDDARFIQESIARWTLSAMPDATPEAHNEKTRLQMQDLQVALSRYEDGCLDKGPLRDAVADVAIMLFQTATYAGFDLHHAVRDKMILNEQRTWVKGPDGTYSHTGKGHRYDIGDRVRILWDHAEKTGTVHGTEYGAHGFVLSVCLDHTPGIFRIHARSLAPLSDDEKAPAVKDEDVPDALMDRVDAAYEAAYEAQREEVPSFSAGRMHRCHRAGMKAAIIEMRKAARADGPD